MRGAVAAWALVATAGGCALQHAVRRGADAGPADAPDGADALDVPRDVPPDLPPDAPLDGCEPGALACGAGCALPSDPRTCGSCDNDCTALPGVDGTRAGCTAGGQCRVRDACAAGRADCDGNPANGCEVDTTTPSNCGGCGVRCVEPTALCGMLPGTPPSYQCTSVCTPAAPTLCGTSCTNTSTDVNNCGACGARCAPRASAVASCVAGSCRYACIAGFNDCGGVCTANDTVTACGPSCTRCPAPPNGRATCSGGRCGVTCNPGFNPCGGACVANSPAACGAGCAVCAAPANGTATCTGGACDFVCDTGFTRVGGVCVLAPPMTCGNRALDPGESCDDGNTASGDGCSASCALEGSPTDNCPGQSLAVRTGGTQVYLATTAGMSNRISGCGANGPERVFALTAAASGTLDVRVSPMGFDALIRHGGSCPPGNASCVNNAGSGGSESISVGVSAGGTYYVQVDGVAFSAGFFTLEATLR